MKNTNLILTKIFFKVLLVLFVSSCTSYKSANFGRQKFTDLKEIKPEAVAELNMNEFNSDKNIFQSESPISDDTLKKESLVCDTIIMQSGAYLDCIILEIDNENITYTDCPPSDHKFKIPVTKIKHYNKQERPEVIDSESETERVTDPESLNEEYELRKAKGIKLFLISLIFLFTFGLGILCAIFLFEIAGAVIIIGSLIIGYPVLANAAKNLKIAQLLKPEEFIKSKIDGLFVLIILGMMLFGSIPFLIPFFIAWLIILKLAKKEVNLIK